MNDIWDYLAMALTLAMFFGGLLLGGWLLCGLYSDICNAVESYIDEAVDERLSKQ